MIGKAITSILTNDSGVTGYVGTKLYAILMEEDTILPAILYSVDSIEPTYVKTGWIGDAVRFQTRIITKSYAESNTIAIAVRTAFERKAGTYSNIILGPIYMDGYSESYDRDGDSYSIILNFRTNVKQY